MEQSIYRELDESDSNESNPATNSFTYNTLPALENSGDPRTSFEVLSARDMARWRWANIENLDIFLRDVYDYYTERGFLCITLSRALRMITILFVVAFSTYLYSCIDYSKLRIVPSLQDAKHNACLAHTSWLHYFALYLFALLWVLKVFQYVGDSRSLWEIHEFYYHMLGIKENEIQTISWQQVVERMVELRSTNGASKKRLDAHGIVNRIMRQENYMIALYNKNILDLEIELPFVGKYEFLTKLLEWCISMCIEDYIFNERGQVRKLVLREEKRDLLARGLRRRFQFFAIVSVVLAPFALLFMTLYYFFRYFNDFYSNPKNLGIRQYTPLAEWKCRELNELYHLFKRRLSMSDEPAKRYISQFPREKTELVIKFFIFVFSSFAAVLVTLSIYDPELLNLEIRPGQNVLFYLTSLGIAIAICRAMLSSPQEQAIYQPEPAMRQIIEFTHYFPDEWEGKLHTEPVKEEYTKLYDLKPKIILRDLFSVALNPVILGIKLAKRSERIIDFFREFSVNMDDLGGNVCSLAVFNTERVNRVKSRSDALDKFYSTQDGKMLKSYLNFMDVYGPAQSRTMTSIYQSAYGSQSDSQFKPLDNSPSTSRPDMDSSVMGQYDRIRQGLSTVAEEETVGNHPLTHSQLSSDVEAGTIGGEDEDDDDENIAGDGVLGLLNNIYRR